MVCPRCIAAVEQVLNTLQLPYHQVALGKVTLAEDLSAPQKSALAQALQEQGFELLANKDQALINRVKSLLIERVHHQENSDPLKLSEYLSAQLHLDYSSISKLFSTVEGITIERYTALQRVEKIKELLVYDEMNLNEMAEEIGFSSGAYLSSFFKKETGMSPRQFRQEQGPRRSLDQVGSEFRKK